MTAKLIYKKEFDWIVFEVWNDKPDFSFKQVHQIHSPLIENFQDASNEIKADGIFFTKEELKEKPIAIKTADCLPILIWEEDRGFFLHAGWRGLYENIIENAKTSYDKAFIGPCISQLNFEVTSEFKEYFPNSSNFSSRAEKLFFDLVAEAQQRIYKLNSQANVEDSGICTFSNLDYNSFRRNKTQKRNYNIVKFKG